MLQSRNPSELNFPLDPEEQIGRAYFQIFHRCLDYVDLSFLLTRKDPFNFSCLSHVQARKHKEQQMSKLSVRYAGTLMEQLFISSGLHAEIQHLPRFIDIPAHRHEFFEIVCTLKGTCIHTVENACYTMYPGDITIIPPGVRHHLLGDSKGLSLTIKIRRTTFDRTFSSLMREHSPLSSYFAQALYSRHYQDSLMFHCKEDPILTDLLLTMLDQQTQRKAYFQQLIEGLLITFFSYLLQNYEQTIEFSRKKHTPEGKMTAVENYLQQNFSTATLKSAAEKFSLTPSYLSTAFKAQTGRTFSCALQEIRMEHAAEMLTKTEQKISQVCEQTGYQDTTQFIRTFKKYYGMTPLQFRIAHSAPRQYTERKAAERRYAKWNS